ncbi:glycosyltransferase family 2 protein [Gemmatimonadota bacterium]
MKLVMTLLVRNEEDIVGQNIEFHLNNSVDFFIVTDNLSEDGTRDILEAYRRQGVLHYLHEPEDNYNQAVWVTRMSELGVTEFGADWVINNDADEFWWAEAKNDLKAVLRDVPASVLGLEVSRHNFVPRPGTDTVSFLETMIYRETVSLNGLGQPLPPKVCHRALPDLSVAQGNHAIRSGRRTLKLPATDELCIFHFPMRTPAQFSKKIEKGGAAYTRSGLPRGLGSIWRMLYEAQKEGRLSDYMEERFYDDERLQQGLATRTLIEDQRLLQFFKNNGLPIEPGEIPRAPASD